MRQDGASGYIIDGRMLAGFAMTAYPSQHGATTFVVNSNGVVYQKIAVRPRKRTEFGSRRSWPACRSLEGRPGRGFRGSAEIL